MFCTHCGKQNPAAANYCYSCGNVMPASIRQSDTVLSAEPKPGPALTQDLSATTAGKQCPKCGSQSVESVSTCDCGHSFLAASSNRPASKRCPACGLPNRAVSRECVCGFDFSVEQPSQGAPISSESPSAVSLETNSKNEAKLISGPVGVGGWLLLVVFGLTILGPLTMFVYPTTFREVVDRPAFLVLCLIVAGLVGYSVFAGLALWNRWDSAPSIARGYYYASLLAMLLGTAVGVMSGVLDNTKAIAQLPGIFLGSLIWILYFQKSKRVAATYGSGLAQGPINRQRARFAAVLAAALFLLASSSLYESDEWTTYRSALGRYSVTGPGNARLSTDNSGPQTYTAAFGNDFRAFSVTDFEVSASLQPETVLSNLKNNVTQILKATITSSESYEFSGSNPALRFRATYVEDGAAGEAFATAIIANGRAYLILAGGNASGRMERDADRFISSFALEE